MGVWLLILFRVICFPNNLNTGGKLCLTRRLRRIHNAWRSQFKLNLVFKVQGFRFGVSVVHHLTRRYVAESKTVTVYAMLALNWGDNIGL